jgi:hypothetical protein
MMTNEALDPFLSYHRDGVNIRMAQEVERAERTITRTLEVRDMALKVLE